MRSEIILLAAAGNTDGAVAQQIGVTRQTVGKRRKRFIERGLAGLYDEYRPGRLRSVDDERIAGLIERTLQTTPEGATHWSCRTMARASGLSKSTVQRVCSAFALQPHRQRHFKISTDPLFIEKVRDVVGL